MQHTLHINLGAAVQQTCVGGLATTSTPTSS